MSVRDDITVYWGVSSGGSHAAMRRHYEGDPWYQDAPKPTHLEVSWRTVNNQIWAGPRWMIDSGGAPQTIIANNGHPNSIQDYIDYLRNPPTKYGDDRADITVDKFALRDWPCEPVVREQLGLTVEELQYRTLIDHINMMDRLENENIEGDPVAVLQGWNIDDYLRAIDLYRDHGLLTDELAIGTLCGRDDTTLIRNYSWRIARNLPSRINLHGFGVKQSSLSEPDVLRIFDSIDTGAWNITLRQATKDGVKIGPPGGKYEDYVEWDDRGNPRFTARNHWLDYRGYANRMKKVVPAETPSDVRVVTLDQLHELTGTAPSPGQRVDEYLIGQCLCGGYIDPGRPDPHYGPSCRSCERAALNIQLQRIDLEDRLQVEGIDAITASDRPVSGFGAFRDSDVFDRLHRRS